MRRLSNEAKTALAFHFASLTNVQALVAMRNDTWFNTEAAQHEVHRLIDKLARCCSYCT
ncbi:hypothetical protein O9993_06800 [Vibrio lentus]|nr:hypothetical protein [Vibrio lentus]